MKESPYLEKIRTVRKLKRFDQDYMAKKLGFSDQTVYSKYETGKTPMTLQVLEGIAHVFDMSVPELLSFDEKMVFNQCTQVHSIFGNGNHYHEANAKLVEELNARISEQAGHVKHLEEEVAFLRGQLGAQGGTGK